MSKPVKFYHAGCPVCVSAENAISGALDQSRYEVEVVHLGELLAALKKQKTPA